MYKLKFVCVSGPRLFLSCPMNTAESHSWFTDLWNYSIIPYMIEALRDAQVFIGFNVSFVVFSSARLSSEATCQM